MGRRLYRHFLRRQRRKAAQNKMQMLSEAVSAAKEAHYHALINHHLDKLDALWATYQEAIRRHRNASKEATQRSL